MVLSNADEMCLTGAPRGRRTATATATAVAVAAVAGKQREATVFRMVCGGVEAVVSCGIVLSLVSVQR